MGLGVCEKCKNIDLIDRSNDCICPKCGAHMFSLEIDVKEWNALNNYEMQALVDKALNNNRPLIKQLQHSSTTAEKTNSFIEPSFPENNNSNSRKKRVAFDTPMLPIICICLCVLSYFCGNLTLSFILSLVVLGLAIFTIIKKCRAWGLSIVALVLATGCIILALVGSVFDGIDNSNKSNTAYQYAFSLLDKGKVDEIEKTEKKESEKKDKTSKKENNNTNRSNNKDKNDNNNSNEEELPKQSIRVANLDFEIPGDLNLVEDGSDFKIYSDKKINRFFGFTEIKLDYDFNTLDSDQKDQASDLLGQLHQEWISEYFTDETDPEYIRSITNIVQDSGTSGNIYYSFSSFDVQFNVKKNNTKPDKWQDMKGETILFVNNDCLGMILYAYNESEYPDDATYYEILESAGIYLNTPISTDGVNPDMKEFLDNYEDFMDEYVEFMKKYSENPDDAMSMIDDYYDILEKYEDFATKAEQYNQNQDEMSKEDLEYYLDSMNRIQKKYLEIL